MILKRAFTLFLCLFMVVVVLLGPQLLQSYRVDYNKSYENMKSEIPWRGVITVWDYPRLNIQNGTKLSWISSKIKEFEKLHPGVYIDFKELDPANGPTLLKAAASTGAYPDVAPVGSDYYFISEGLLEELDSLLTAADREDYLPSALQSVSCNGKLYGMPWMMTGYTMLLNTELFNQKEVPLPQEGNWSYDQFLEAAKKLTYDTNRRKGPDVFGFNAVIQQGSKDVYGMLMCDGGEIISSESGRYAFDSMEALSGFQKLWQLKHIYKVTPDNFGAATQGEVFHSFVNNKTAVIAAPTWAIPYIRSLSNDSLQFVTACYPSGSGERSSAEISNISSFGVFKQKDENKRRVCMEFVKFITQSEKQEELTSFGYFPVRKSGELLYQNDKEMSLLQQKLSAANPIPRHRNWEQIDLILQSRIKAALVEDLKPEDAIREAKELLRKYIE